MSEHHCCYACGQTLPQRAYNLPSSATWETDLLAHLEADLGRESDGFRAIWTLVCEPRITTVRQWSTALGFSPTGLANRWCRAGLPTPRQYVAAVQLIRVAALWERDDLSAKDVANVLAWSSPQSLFRFVRLELGLTISEARVLHAAGDFVQHLREDLILPHLETLRHVPILATDIRVERRRRARARAAQDAAAHAGVAA